ncbi:MAG: pyridoxamine 5'-phosphate oxidase family protein [Planctomycetes bacterium]|nr:pyridoxamine 5'-phosphate oxidase family protein [Planctomycetota bacterium]
MNRAVLEDAAKLSVKTGHVFVATANEEAVPHVTAAEVLVVVGDDSIEITEWFCPVTVANLQVNRSISIVVWDPAGDMGYQLLGNMEKLCDEAVVDGYSSELDVGIPKPQVERRITICVDRVLDFSVAPHSDVEE